MRVAILQTGGVHEEIVPSLIHALGPGHDVAAWLNAKCRDTRGDIFALMPELPVQVTYVPLQGLRAWEELHRDIRAFAPDLLIVATFQRDAVADFAARFDVPVLGVIHNVRMAARAEAVMATVASGRCKPLTLAPHVAAAFHRATNGVQIDDLAVIEPVYWGTQSGSVRGPRTIVIPGGVNSASRDFDGLLAALGPSECAQLLRNGNLRLQILGGGPDRARVEADVTSMGLRDVVTFAPLGPNGRVLYDTYIAALRQAWALLPLIPLTKSDYRDFKITSAIPTAIGFGLPLALDRWTSSVYRCPCLEVAPTAEAGLRGLAGLSDTDHKSLSTDITQFRDAALARNRAALGRILLIQSSAP